MSKPITIPVSSTVGEAIKKLIDFKISRLVVGQSGVNGIISEKDIGFFLLKDKSKVGLDKIQLNQFMKESVFVSEDTTLKEAAKIMIDKNIGSLLIGNKQELKGIITKTDIVRYFSENFGGKGKVVELKNPGFISIKTESPLSEVVQVMLGNRISRLIVKNTDNKPVGIISFRDLFEISLQLGSEEDVTESAALSGAVRTGFLSEEGFGGVSLAKDVMTPNIISIKPDEDLAVASKIMLENGVNGLLIDDDLEGKKGIISKTDIIKYFTLI